MRENKSIAMIIACGLVVPGAWLLYAQGNQTFNSAANHAEFSNCIHFTGLRDKIAGGVRKGIAGKASAAATVTAEVASKLARPEASWARAAAQEPITADPQGTIDTNLFAVMSEQGVKAAPKTNDYEFIRRVTLDLTGRIPTAERVQSFIADTRSNKRALLVDELLASAEWVDKWTMFFGDLLRNVTRNTQVNRFPNGVAAFHKWIRDSLTANKPYNQMATELMTINAKDSHTVGELNWLVGAFVTGGPVQDVWDGQAVAVSATFLGLSHLNCLLCHNGRGHLDSLSLWGKNTTRMDAWKLAAFFSHTFTSRTTVQTNASSGIFYYWNVEDNTRFRGDYPLDTNSGNRPARTASVQSVAPVYIFNGKTPSSGESYRQVLAREVTADLQFARAAVNYIWKQFFGLGIVEPADSFDPARLDPNNPPGDGWTLQPANAKLLNALAQDFINAKFDLKALMRQIANSEAYQLSSRYEGTWKTEYEKLFARHFVRRLWAEEMHDAIAQASNLIPSYDMSSRYPGMAPVTRAMQLPEPVGTPDGGMRASGRVYLFLDAFIRGNRDDEDRSEEGGIAQALNLMNDSFVMTRIRSTGTGANANLLLVKNLSKTDDQLVDTLFLTVLSRPATATEKTAALAQLKSGDRSQAAEDLLWSLFNKVDFTFNY